MNDLEEQMHRDGKIEWHGITIRRVSEERYESDCGGLVLTRDRVTDDIKEVQFCIGDLVIGRVTGSMFLHEALTLIKPQLMQASRQVQTLLPLWHNLKEP
jgi:hypothetical protein